MSDHDLEDDDVRITGLGPRLLFAAYAAATIAGLVGLAVTAWRAP